MALIPRSFHELQEPALNDSTSDTPPDYLPNPCEGTYQPEIADGAGERIVDGFYQLPGSTEFYGSDSGIYGDETRRPENAGDIDNACGVISKVVYDAAAIADPEIDYNDFDTDKDGVVDFFMLVYAGCGGNGPSQRDCQDRAPERRSERHRLLHGHGLRQHLAAFLQPRSHVLGRGDRTHGLRVR